MLSGAEYNDGSSSMQDSRSFELEIVESFDQSETSISSHKLRLTGATTRLKHTPPRCDQTGSS